MFLEIQMEMRTNVYLFVKPKSWTLDMMQWIVMIKMKVIYPNEQ